MMTDYHESFVRKLRETADSTTDGLSSAKAQMQLISHWISTSPIPFFNELRETAPIFKAPAFTLVTRYKDVQDVLTLNDIFTTDLLKQSILRFIGNTVVELPPSPEYEQRKSVLRLAFPMADIERYHSILIETSASLLSDMRPDMSFDLVGYATMLPARAISQYLGLGKLPSGQLVQWMHAINEGAVRNLGNAPQINEAAEAASREIKPLIRDILESTRSKLSKNTSSQEITVLERYLMMQSVSTTYTSDEDIISSLLFMMSACIDLTSTAITNVVVELMQRPEVLELAITAAQSDTNDEISGYVWEALRFRQPSPGVINSCVKDFTLGRGTEYEEVIPDGTLVLAAAISAMHDPGLLKTHRNS
jgi:cytochrome P450